MRTQQVLGVVGNKAKGRISKTGVARKQIRPNFPKNEYLFTPWYAHVCVSGVKKCSLFGKFGMICFLQAPVLRFALLPHYRRSKVEAGFLRGKASIFKICAANICLFKFNNRNTREGCGICSELIITPERRHWRRSGFLLLTWNMFRTFF